MPEIYALHPGDLQDIPSLFGKLVFVAGLTSQGRSVLAANHHERLDRETEARIGVLHRTLFLQWLSSSLEDRATELTIHPGTKNDFHCLGIRNLPDEKEAFEYLLPKSATLAEESLFTSDLRLLRFILNGSLDVPNPEDSARIDPRDDWRIRALMARVVLSQNGDQNTLKVLGGSLRLSARHLGRVFRNNTGMAFHRYLRGARLAKAADLLRTLTASIKEISAAVGYTSSSNFSRDFASITRISPTRYRGHVMTVTLYGPDEASRERDIQQSPITKISAKTRYRFDI